MQTSISYRKVDPRYGGFLNADLAEYVLPVNAAIGRIHVDFIDRPNPLLNTAGVKGLGEVAMVDLAAAVANAIFRATGRRLRHLPIRIEDLISLLPDGRKTPLLRMPVPCAAR